MKIVFLLTALAWTSAATERPAAIRSLVDRARSAPAEFAADALIRIASLERLDKAWRSELLEDAFGRARGAAQPFKRRPAVPGGQGPFLERAFSQDLDTLSLEMRAVAGMLPLDPGKARELFLQVQAPRLTTLACKDLLVYDVSAFYAVAGRIAAETYSKREIAQDEPFKLLLRYTVPASPAQVGPIAGMLASAKMSDQQFQALLAAFLGGLKEIRGDDRSFSSARPDAVRIKELKAAVVRRGASPVPLLEGYRAYLVRHLTGNRCADNTRVEAKVIVQTIPFNVPETDQALNIGIYFNQTLRQDPVPPLTPEEQMPADSEGAAETGRACDTPECNQMGALYRALIIKPDQTTTYSPAERTTSEWNHLLKQYLASLEAWKQDTGATSLEHFRFKCGAYSDLLAVVPNGSNRELVVRTTLDFLSHSRLEVPSPMEWFLPVNALLGMLALNPLGLGPLLDELRESADPVIALYADLEKSVPRTPDRIMPLL